MLKPNPKKGMPPKKAKKPLKRTVIKKKHGKKVSENTGEDNKKKHRTYSGIARSPIKKKFKKSGELSVFKEIWEEREHICQVTGYALYEFDIRCFSHILSKGSYPNYRLDKRNIWIVLPDIHHIYEFGDRNHPMFDEKNKVKEQLKQEYYTNNR